MRSIDDINTQFRNVADTHLQIKAFYTNSVMEMDINKMDVVDFPFLYAQCTGANIEVGMTSFDYEVIIADLVVQQQQPYLDQVYSETHLLMQDIIALFQDTDAPSPGAALTMDSGIGLEMPILITPFSAAYDNLLTGWTAQWTIRVPNYLDLCNVPIAE